MQLTLRTRVHYERIMARVAWKRVFAGAAPRVVRLGDLEVTGVLHVGDPLAGSFVPLDVPPGHYTVELAFDDGRIAAARAMIAGASPSSHRPAGDIVVDAGKACFATRDPAVSPLTDNDRESLLSDKPTSLGTPPWLHSFDAGWGDGRFSAFIALEGNRPVGVWMDFDVVEIAEAQPPEVRLTDAACLRLFTALEAAVASGTSPPDLSPLETGTREKARKVLVKLFPRLARLLGAEPLPEAVVTLAMDWLSFPEFQQALAETPLSGARWGELHTKHRLFRGVQGDASVRSLNDVLTRAIGSNEEIPRDVRLAVGNPKVVWHLAAAELDPPAIGFFNRRDSAGSSPNEEARKSVETAFLALIEKHGGEQAYYNAIENLRRYLPSRLP
jgi:hypothetical protein